jgi:CDGSH-type Zn-finger protein
MVKGKVPIEYEENEFYKIRNRVTLCICGLSKNKPFCDGTHVKAKFKDE